MRVGSYTFSPWKVVWKYIAREFVCAVIGTADDPYLGKKLLLPNEKVMYVAAGCEEEAYYLCGVLSSAAVSRCVKGYMNPTSISAHVLSRLEIPQYDPADPIHRAIAEACREGHHAEEIGPYLERIDSLVAALQQRPKGVKRVTGRLGTARRRFFRIFKNRFGISGIKTLQLREKYVRLGRATQRPVKCGRYVRKEK